MSSKSPKTRIARDGTILYPMYLWLPQPLHEALVSEVTRRGYPVDKSEVALEWLRAGSKKKRYR